MVEFMHCPSETSESVDGIGGFCFGAKRISLPIRILFILVIGSMYNPLNYEQLLFHQHGSTDRQLH
jgi:hypothetical protein